MWVTGSFFFIAWIFLTKPRRETSFVSHELLKRQIACQLRLHAAQLALRKINCFSDELVFTKKIPVSPDLSKNSSPRRRHTRNFGAFPGRHQCTIEMVSCTVQTSPRVPLRLTNEPKSHTLSESSRQSPPPLRSKLPAHPACSDKPDVADGKGNHGEKSVSGCLKR